MTTDEIIGELAEIKRQDPEGFYNGLGLGDGGVHILDPFFSGSYELGLVVGAKWMQSKFTKEEMVGQTKHHFLPGDQVLHQGQKAEVVDAYPTSITIRIGRNTYKSVLPGELQRCGPDGEEPRGTEVRFG